VKALDGKATADLVCLYKEGESTCARVTIGEHRHTLTDVLRSWGCCSCSLSTQDSICRHHVLVLLHTFPDVDRTTFSNALMRLAGRKFGAAGMCFPGVGGMQPLYDKLSVLQQEGKLAPHAQTPDVISFQPDVSGPLINQAHALMAEYQKQQNPAVASAAPSNTSGAVIPVHRTSVQAAASLVSNGQPSFQCAQSIASTSAPQLEQPSMQVNSPLQQLQA
jgi:hypothetical protein